MTLLSWIVYIPLQILSIPIVILGALTVAYKQIRVSKKLGLSMTAIEVINGRWTMHLFDMREDEATAKLAQALPNTSLAGLFLSLFPLWVKYKIAGKTALYPRVPELGKETVVDLFVARTLYIDSIIEKAVARGVDQFVVLGAGYDTRAYGSLMKEPLHFFEIDQAKMQEHKRAMLNAAKVSCEHVKFLSVDFSVDNTFDKLIASGFDETKKTIFLWEGVTLYLSEVKVRKLMREVAERAAQGSILIADIYAERFLTTANKGSTKKVLEEADEGLDFGLDMEKDHERVLNEFVHDESLSLGESYPMGANNKKGPFVAVLEMIVSR